MRRAPFLLLGALWACASCELMTGLTGERRFDPPGGRSSGGSGSPGGKDGSADTSAPFDDGGSGGAPTAGGSRGSGGSGGGGPAGTGGDAGGAGGDAVTSGGAGGDAGLDGTTDGGDADADAEIDASPDDPVDAGPGPVGPSCEGMTATECRGESCCTSILVPGGTFDMGRTSSPEGTDFFSGGGAGEEPEHPVTVSPYRLDKYEVTVGRFRRFYQLYDGPSRDGGAAGSSPENGDGANPRVPGSGWQSAWNGSLPADRSSLKVKLICSSLLSWTTVESSREALPMVCLTWYEAFAFCAWDGGRLPTEAEWEFAAAGGSKNRRFPWGPEAPDEHNDLAVVDCLAGGDPGICDIVDLPAVGSRPRGDGRYGHADLAGSVWEFTLDWWDPEFYERAEASGQDVANLLYNPGGFRATRGGGFVGPGTYTRAVTRNNVAQSSRYNAIGVRCARDP